MSVITLSQFISPTSAAGATWADRGSYSISWYDKNQTSFDISTPQELAGIAYLVNNNFADFSGKTINILADIDLSGKDWMPIGLGTYVFKGSIEGNNHTISNINITTGTSGSPYASGFWIYLQNAKVANLNFKGKINSNKNYLGFLAYKAISTKFENISVSCNMIFSHSVSGSTGFKFTSSISGMVSEATNCNFLNIRVDDIIDYTFGDFSGGSCYGNISLDAGGLVAKGSNSTFTKCHATNQFTAVINGYLASNYYTSPGDSFITFGGIVGTLSGNSSKVIGCLAENIYFEGSHPVGNYDTVRFQFGGVVRYMSKYDSSSLKNCVAINDTYNIYGHDYSWVASWYHTNSYFGGVAYEAPKNFAGCYSNNDVSKNISKCETDRTMENGSTSFSKSQMNTQDFVDELNFYSQLEFDEDYWTLESGKLSIKWDNSGDAGIESVKADQDTIIGIYSLQGYWVGTKIEELSSGIYIVKTFESSRKIVVR